MQRINKTRKSGRVASNVYYRCNGSEHEPSKCRNMVPLDDIEAWVDLHFTEPPPFGVFAHREIIETVIVPGNDHEVEISEIEADLRDLDYDAPDFAKRQKAMLGERARLKALPAEPPQVIERPTGRTVGDLWPTLDDEAKRNYMTAAGVKVRVMSNGTLRKEPGAEIRYLTGGDPGRVVGTLTGIVAPLQPAS
jgi:hypothetical protein